MFGRTNDPELAAVADLSIALRYGLVVKVDQRVGEPVAR